MSASKKKGKVRSYVTLRVQCRKTEVVTTYGTVDVRVPRANRRRVRPSWMKESQLVELLDDTKCIAWGERKSGYPSDLIVGVEILFDGVHGHRCRFNPETKRWEVDSD
jgi:hypothetical protein